MTAMWLLLAIVCSAKAPHPCKQELLITYHRLDDCRSGQQFIEAYPQPRQIKVWCQRKEPDNES